MVLVVRYFALIAAGIAALNWAISYRRLTSGAVDGPVDSDRARRVLRFFWGGSIAFFLVLAALQWLGGYKHPLFPFYERTQTAWSSAAWAAIFAFWAALVVGLWRPGVADTAARLGLYRGRPVSARTFRLLATLMLLVNAAVFGALLLGLWGPIPKLPF
jgi:hypothetical protein